MNKITRLAVVCVSTIFIAAGAGAGQLEGIIETDEALTVSFNELKAVSARYGVEISVKADMDRRVLIEVRLAHGTPVLKDLDRALNSRDQWIMGFPVLIRSRSAFPRSGRRRRSR